MGEAEIIKGLIAGNEKVFRHFVDQYRQIVINTCLGLVHSIEDAEDVAQDVFIEVYRSINTFKGNAKLSTWIYRIAINRSLNFIRDKKKRTWLQSFDDTIKSKLKKQNQHAAVSESNPEIQLENRQRAIILHEAIDSLPKNQRVAFTLNKYEDLGNKEIAEIMNLSVSSVESLLYRAKRNIQKKLYRCYKNNCI